MVIFIINERQSLQRPCNLFVQFTIRHSYNYYNNYFGPLLLLLKYFYFPLPRQWERCADQCCDVSCDVSCDILICLWRLVILTDTRQRAVLTGENNN